MRLDILYFLGYDIDEPLPWHSTISRTRQLYPEEVFEEVFTKILTMCIEKGMVSGHTQAIDSAPIKANASMDSLELKVPKEDLETHLRSIRHISSMDKEAKPVRPSKTNKASKEQKSIMASDGELQAIKSRNKKWTKDQDQRPGAGNKGSKYTSNKTHYSPTDPDARISVKPGKARKLNYMGQLSVDTGHHVITDIQACHADKKDNQYLKDITNRLKPRLHRQGLLWHNLLADTGYSPEASGARTMPFWNKRACGVLSRPMGLTRAVRKVLSIMENRTIICVQREKPSPLKRYFMRQRTTQRRKNTGHPNKCA
jgi:hypothetical protein